MDNDRIKFRVFYAIVVSIVFLLIFISIVDVFGASWGAFPNPSLPRSTASYDVLVGGTFEAGGTPPAGGLPRVGFWSWIDSTKCKYYVAGAQNKVYVYVAPLDNHSIIDCCGYQLRSGYRYSNTQSWDQSSQWNYTNVATSQPYVPTFDINGERWYRIIYGTTNSRATNPIYTNIYIWDDNLYDLDAQPALEYLLANYQPNTDYNVTSYDDTVPTFSNINVLNTQVTSNAGGSDELLMFNSFNLGTYLRDVVVDLGDGSLSDGTTFDSSTYKLQFAFSVDSQVKNEGVGIGLKKFVGSPFAYQSDILTYNNLFQRTSLSTLNLIGTIEGSNVDTTYLGQLKQWIHSDLTGTKGVVYYKSISCYVRLLRLSDNHYGNWTIGTYDNVYSGYQVINAKPIGDGLSYIQTVQQTSSGQGATQGIGINSGYTYTSSSINGDVAYMSNSQYGGDSFSDFSSLSDDIKQVPLIITTVFSFLPPQVLALVGVCFALLVIFFILKFLQ